MKILLTSADFGRGYEITPCNARIARRMKRETGSESVLFQTDWDFPALARSLGWSGKVGRERCEHRGTDGTIACPDCGRGPGDFIAAAARWLDAREGRRFVRHGADEYFSAN